MMHLRDHTGNVEQTQTLPVDAAASGTPSEIQPAADADLAVGSQAVLRLAFDAGSQPNASSVDYLDQSIGAVATLDGKAYHWLPVAGDATAIETILHYAGQQQAHNLIPVANADNAAIMVTGLVNNQLFAEGDTLTFGYQVNLDADHLFDYAELRLEDFNGNPLLTLPLSETQGQVSLRLPAVAVQESFRLRIRAYLDDDYRYSETQTGLRIAPRLDLPTFSLSGLPDHIEAGSELQLALSGYDTARYQGSIQLYDGQENLLFSGDEHLQVTLPGGLTTIAVTATVSDGYGNSVVQHYQSTVTDTLRLNLAGDLLSFDHFAADVGDYWYSSTSPVSSTRPMARSPPSPDWIAMC
ncbi:MAG: hypothetical protein P8178_19040 [Candidatus Thiodiazotropha sp.]